MLLFVVPISAAGTHLVDAAACMCPAAAGTVVAAEEVVPPDTNCLPVVVEATDVVVVVAIVAASVAGAAIVVVSVAAVIDGVVDVGVATLTDLSAAVPSTPLVCLAQKCLSPFVLSLSTLVLLLFHQAAFCAAHACMHLRTCGPHHV